jgi:hypothetical protein
MTTGLATAEQQRGPSYVFQNREVTLPVEVRDASSASATYLVSSDAARDLIPGDELEIAEVLPGRTLFSIACIDYRDNDLGNYDEISLAFFVRERGAGRHLPYLGTAVDFLGNKLGTYIHRLPVNQSFTCEAGCGIWGFPKTVEDIELRHFEKRSLATLTVGGEHVLTFSVDRGGTRTLPDSEMTTYTYIDGVAHKTAFSSGAEGVGFQVARAELVIGDHAISKDLRSLGLPKRPLLSVWMEHMHGRFEAPVPL